MNQYRFEKKHRDRPEEGREFLLRKKDRLDQGDGEAPANGGVDVFEGDKKTLLARKESIVATGSTPRSFTGIDAAKADHHHDEAIHLPEVPKSM